MKNEMGRRIKWINTIITFHLIIDLRLLLFHLYILGDMSDGWRWVWVHFRYIYEHLITHPFNNVVYVNALFEMWEYNRSLEKNCNWLRICYLLLLHFFLQLLFHNIDYVVQFLLLRRSSTIDVKISFSFWTILVHITIAAIYSIQHEHTIVHYHGTM